MNAKLTIKEAIEHLQQHKTNWCCEDVKCLLVKLGFEVRDGKQGGHKIFVHQGLSAFQSGSFNCAHGKNPEIKPAYLTKIIKILEQHQKELEEHNS